MPPLSGIASVCLYPEAGEATILLVPAQPGLDLRGRPGSAHRLAEDRSTEYRLRSRSRLRRWLRANRCKYLWTFTFAQAVYEWDELVDAVRRFLERFAGSQWGRGVATATRVPLALIAEPHPGGHGWHVHGATDRKLDWKMMGELWGHGFVYVTGPKGKASAWPQRQLARYLAKYLSKELVGEELHGCSPRPPRAKYWWKRHGFAPTVIHEYFETLEQAEKWLKKDYGKADERRHISVDVGFLIEGWWLSFPDECLRALPERVQAVSRPQGGQP